MRCLVAMCVGAIALAQSPATIKGIVIDPAGAGIPNASVKLRRSLPPGSVAQGEAEALKQEQSGPQGAFQLDGVPPGRYDIEIASSGFVSFLQHQIDVRSGKKINLGRIGLGISYPCNFGLSIPYQPPSIELRPSQSGATRVSGVAYEPFSRQNNLPPVSVVLTAHEKGRKSLSTKTNSKGEYTFDSVPPGLYGLRASLRGRATIAVDDVPVKAGRETVIEQFPMEKCRLSLFCGTHKRFRQSFICE